MNPIQQTLEKMRQKQELLAILIFGLVAVILWIVISLTSSQRRSAISAEMRRLAKPLTPDINRQVLQRLARERICSESQLQDFPIYKVVEDELSGLEQIVEVE